MSDLGAQASLPAYSSSLSRCIVSFNFALGARASLPAYSSSLSRCIVSFTFLLALGAQASLPAYSSSLSRCVVSFNFSVMLEDAGRDACAPNAPALLQGQSSACAHNPAFTGLFSIYRSALLKCFWFRMYRSNGSRCQNSPARPSTLLHSFAVNDFQLWAIWLNSQRGSGV